MFSSNVKILVNGRENRIGEGGNDVDNIPASMIEKVEVIPSPSAKYDPEGMAGIINIEIKKGNYQGLNGSIRFNGRNNNHYNPSDMNSLTYYMNYRRNKLNFYSTLSTNNKMRVTSGYRNVTIDYYH